MVQRPPVQAFMQKVHRVRIPDDKAYSGIAGHNDIAVTTPRGCFKLRTERVPGSPAWPMTAWDLIAKFRDCAEPVLVQRALRNYLIVCNAALSLQT
jgi:hypothetical protein